MSDLPATVRSRLRFTGADVVNLTEVVADLEALLADEDFDEVSDLVEETGPEEPEPSEPEVTTPVVARLACDTAALARELHHADDTWLQELLTSLNERRQVVLEGPPGTGKTFVVQQAARRRAACTRARARSCSSTRPTPTRTSSRVGVRPTTRTAPGPGWP